MTIPVRFRLNGSEVSVDATPTVTLLDWLREERGLRGTKEGCNEGDCGACTVVVSSKEGGHVVHRAVNACILLMPQIHGRVVTTVEGLGGVEPHPVQAAMVKYHGSQCGFCTPGIVMSLWAAHREGRRDWNDVLAGNLCRCTGYAPIVRAAEAAAEVVVAELAANMVVAEASVTVPDDLDSFAEWYAAHPDATLIAGATDVGLWLTKALRTLPQPVFLHRLDALKRIEIGETGMRIGAGVTVARLRGAMAGVHPEFAELLRRFGGVQVRNAATIGGNIANGSPIGDGAPAFIALGAVVVLRRGGVRRELPLEDFFLDYGRQDRREGEFVESLFMPRQADTLRCYKVSKRFDSDISAVCGCFNIALENGRVTGARVAFGGMAATPKRALATEAALIGEEWSEATVERAQKAMSGDFAPISDMRAGARYRMRVAENLLQRVYLETTGEVQTRLVGRGAA